MTFVELWRLVLLNIVENKFKVVLTSIGIVVGAATIVLVIAVGRGGQMDVEDQFKNLNAASVEISTSSGSGGGTMIMMGGVPPAAGGNMGGGGNQGGRAMMGGDMPGGMFFGGGGVNLREITASLTRSDAEDILLFVPDVAAATISMSGSASVLGGSLEEESDHTVAGVLPDYMQLSNLSIYLGEFISEENEENKEKVCVLGYSLASSMFDSIIDAYDSLISIGGTNFTVIGVLQQMGTVSSGISPDEAVYIPYSSAEKYVLGSQVSPVITVVAGSVNDVESVIANLEILLDENYPGATFTISDAGSKMEAAAQSSKTLQMLLWAVAAIVFVVGGIGIMNVLTVTVKERTKEIGVLKALGMSRRDVLFEFLFEATMISVFGGLVGVLASFGVIPVIERLGTRMEPSTQAYVMAFVFAVITGTLFGFQPAYKASRLIPVDALNHE